jgi:hypothetical protein
MGNPYVSMYLDDSMRGSTPMQPMESPLGWEAAHEV